MRKYEWNSKLLKEPRIKNETYKKTYQLETQIAKLEAKISKVFGYNKNTIRIFNAIEIKFSNVIEGVVSTIYDSAAIEHHTISCIKKIKLRSYILCDHQKDVFDSKLLSKLAKNIKDKHKKVGDRWNKDFGLRDKNTGSLVYKPSCNRVSVNKYFKEIIQKIKKDKDLIDFIISHIQFELIHPFVDGNGRVGRAIIQKQLFKLTNEPIIILLSWAIRQNPALYYSSFIKAHSNFDKAVHNMITLFDYAIFAADKFLKDIETKLKKYEKGILKLVPKKATGLAKDILFNLYLTRSEIENKYNLNYKTIDRIFKDVNDKVIDYNKVDNKRRVFYWNVELEHIIDNHFNDTMLTEEQKLNVLKR